MSIVIPFALRAKAARDQSAKPGEPAQILFFTGVRYERPPEPAPAEREPRRRGRPTRAATRSKNVRQPA